MRAGWVSQSGHVYQLTDAGRAVLEAADGT
jgi:hypothetical protein